MQHKKIKYVPGLISLVGLPLLLLVMGPGEPHTKYVVRFFLPGDKPDSPGSISFTAANVYQLAAKKKVNTIEFREYDHSDDLSKYQHASKLDFVQKEIQRMTALYDSSTVLKIEMGEWFSYGELVWILNQLYLQGVKRYALVNYTLFIFSNELRQPPNPEQENITPLSLENDVIPIITGKPSTRWDGFLSKVEFQFTALYRYFNAYPLLISGFILLIVIPFFFRLKKYRHFISLNTTNRV